MLEFAFGISVAINIMFFITTFIIYKIIKHTRKKRNNDDEIVDFDMMKEFLGSDKL